MPRTLKYNAPLRVHSSVWEATVIATQWLAFGSRYGFRIIATDPALYPVEVELSGSENTQRMIVSDAGWRVASFERLRILPTSDSLNDSASLYFTETAPVVLEAAISPDELATGAVPILGTGSKRGRWNALVGGVLGAYTPKPAFDPTATDLTFSLAFPLTGLDAWSAILYNSAGFTIVDPNPRLRFWGWVPAYAGGGTSFPGGWARCPAGDLTIEAALFESGETHIGLGEVPNVLGSGGAYNMSYGLYTNGKSIAAGGAGAFTATSGNILAFIGGQVRR